VPAPVRVYARPVKRLGTRRVIQLCGAVDATVEYEGGEYSVPDVNGHVEFVRVNGVMVAGHTGYGGWSGTHLFTFDLSSGVGLVPASVAVRASVKVELSSGLIPGIAYFRLKVGETIVYEELCGKVTAQRPSSLPMPSAPPQPNLHTLPIPTLTVEGDWERPPGDRVARRERPLRPRSAVTGILARLVRAVYPK
jgi:hypothetical protein